MKILGGFLFYAFACPAIAAGGDLIISNGQAESGEQVTFTLAVNEAPNAVQALRLDLEYDFTVLRFLDTVPGTQAGREFELFRAFNQAPGVVRIGGVAPQTPGIKKGDSGVLISLVFEVKKSSDCELTVTDLNNDIKHWRADSGRFEAIQTGSATNSEEAQESPAENSEENSEENSSQTSAAVLSPEKNITTGEEHTAANQTASGGDPAENNSNDPASGETGNLSGSLQTSPYLSPRNRTISFNPETRNQGDRGVHEQNQGGSSDAGHQGAEVKMDNTAELNGQAQPSLPARARNYKQDGTASNDMAPVTERKPAFSGIAGPSFRNFSLATSNPSSPEFFKTTADLILQAAILLVLLLVLKELKTRRKDGIYRANHIFATPTEEASG